MQQTDLHQEASAHYLAGRFSEALAAWRQILASDPSDEQALEGVQLCELLAEGSATAADAVEVADEPAAEPMELSLGEPEAEASDPSDAEPIEAIDFEVPDLDIDMPADPTSELPDPDRQNDGIDFGGEAESLDLAGEVPPAPAGAENELQRRVNDLVAEAHAAMEVSDLETARSVLARVFILDETNEVALQLQEQLEESIPAAPDDAAEFVDTADMDAPDHSAAPGEFDLSADAPDGAEIVDGVLPEPEGEVEALAVGAEAAEETVDEPLEASPELAEQLVDEVREEQAVVEDELAEAAPVKKKGIRLPQLNLTGRNRTIAIAAVVAVVALVGVGFWMKLQSVGAPSDVSEPITRAERPAPTPAAEEAAPAEAAAAEAEVVMPTEDLATLLGRGDAELRSGNYAAAIVSFNNALLLDPEHSEAKISMERATEAYREQQELAGAWEQALSDFRANRYRDALRAFYRLPGGKEGDDPKLERYKANAWFNMGLVALRSGRCEEAFDHFNESQSIRDRGVLLVDAIELSRRCRTERSSNAFRGEVDRLELLGLDD